MRIAVNTRILRNEHWYGKEYFLHDVVDHLCKRYPEHTFVLVSDGQPGDRLHEGAHVERVVLPPFGRSRWRRRRWMERRFPRALKEARADAWLSGDGYFSRRAAANGCMFIAGTGDILPAGYAAPPEKIITATPAAGSLFRPLDWKEREAVKTRYTDGKEYLICTAQNLSRAHFMDMLKAFSQLKKQLFSGMNLLLTGEMFRKVPFVEELLSTYRYRKDVQITGYVSREELAGLTAAAYASLYPVCQQAHGLPVPEALQCGVPVVAASAAGSEKTAAGGVLYFDAGRPGEMGEQLCRLYKDEKWRAQLADRGIAYTDQYTLEAAAERIWRRLTELAAR